MALGFGFNKAKILSSAEKYVQQGKLQNAIAEYEKVSKQDPKDLTVLNTIGDLHARLGRNDEAIDYFRRVGDAYAADGFLVKAIAMYKKLTKLNPNGLDAVVRLAELFTQQGLYHDARAQYTAVAEQFVRQNDREKAASILRKMLELEPDNSGMRGKVADLYLKLGQKKEAQAILFQSAQSLYERGTLQGAEDAIARALALDPSDPGALLLSGQIAADAGKGESAIESLLRIADIDSRPGGLRALLRAYCQTGNFAEAEPIAAKLVSVHNDLKGATSLVDALLAGGQPEKAMAVLVQHVDKFLPANRQSLLDALATALTPARDSAPALQSMLELLQRASATGHSLHEVQELLAHAYVKAGDLQRAADLYKELSNAEPENPLHEQNYRQVVARMGSDAATRDLSAQEGSQALMVDEIELSSPVHQEYSRDVSNIINTALTDSELFASYNVPEKAIAPLERALEVAPNDIRVRHRLASLYERVQRFAEAAKCCTVLADVHAAAGFADQALQYREMAAKYAGVAGIEVPASEPVVAAAVIDSTEEASAGFPTREQASAAVAEFELSAPVAAPEEAPLNSSTQEFEIEHASEWEEIFTVEPPESVTAGEGTTQFLGQAELEGARTENPEEIVEEARFYLAHSMTSEAHSAVQRLAEAAPDHPALDELRASLSNAEASEVAEIEIVPAESPATEEAAAQGTVTEFDIAGEIEEPAVAAAELSIASPGDVAMTFEIISEDTLESEPETEPAVTDGEEFSLDVPSELELDIAAEPAEQRSEEVVAEVSAPVEQGSVEEQPPVAPVSQPPAAEEHVAAVHHESQHKQDQEHETAHVFDEIALGDSEHPVDAGLDELISEFGAGEPASFTTPPLDIPPPAPAVAPIAHAEHEADPLAGLLADANDALRDLGPSTPAARPLVTAAKPSIDPPQIPAEVEVPPTVAASSPVNDMLAGLLQEFKDEVEGPETEKDDPETHYNLAVAFREMGLLDEAIGEFQKVCRAIDSGLGFSQPIQAYTWLAQCLVDKGAPQAAVRWYEKALRLRGLSEDSRLALHYDMANAFEVAGNRQAALDNFMEVYGSNIDYRDVTERIRTLQK